MLAFPLPLPLLFQGWRVEHVDCASSLLRESDSVQRLQQLLDRMNTAADGPSSPPSLYVLDDAAALAALPTNTNDSSGLTERRVSATFVNGVKRLAESCTDHGAFLLLVTSQPQALPPALLNLSGLQSHALELGAPSAPQRQAMLRKLCTGLALQPADIQQLASRTAGFQPVDLGNMVQEAVFAAWRSQRQIPLMDDLERATLQCRPAALAGTLGLIDGAAAWPPLIGYDAAVATLEAALIRPLQDFARGGCGNGPRLFTSPLPLSSQADDRPRASSSTARPVLARLRWRWRWRVRPD